jgi:hypothetical protein
MTLSESAMAKKPLYVLSLAAVVVSSLACSRASVAHQPAERFLATKIKHCGGSFYAQWVLSEKWPTFYELRDFDWKIESSEISEADRLNGVRFHGFVVFSWSAHRDNYVVRDKWGKWEGENIWLPFPKSVEILEKNGEWTFPVSAFYNGLTSFSAPACSDVDINKITGP